MAACRRRGGDGAPRGPRCSIDHKVGIEARGWRVFVDNRPITVWLHPEFLDLHEEQCEFGLVDELGSGTRRKPASGTLGALGPVSELFGDFHGKDRDPAGDKSLAPYPFPISISSDGESE